LRRTLQQKQIQRRILLSEEYFEAKNVGRKIFHSSENKSLMKNVPTKNFPKEECSGEEFSDEKYHERRTVLSEECSGEELSTQSQMIPRL
jgi:hypothetical protein